MTSAAQDIVELNPDPAQYVKLKLDISRVVKDANAPGNYNFAACLLNTWEIAATRICAEIIKQELDCGPLQSLLIQKVSAVVDVIRRLSVLIEYLGQFLRERNLKALAIKQSEEIRALLGMPEDLAQTGALVRLVDPKIMQQILDGTSDDAEMAVKNLMYNVALLSTMDPGRKYTIRRFILDRV